MKTQTQDINSIRLRTFLELLRREKGEGAVAQAVADMDPTAQSLIARLDENMWLNGEQEGAILNRLCEYFEVWPMIIEAGRESITGLLGPMLGSLPGSRQLRHYMSWMPSFISFFNVGIYAVYEEARDGKTVLIHYEYRWDPPPQIADVLFVQGLLEGLLGYVDVRHSEVRLRTVHIPMDQWPLDEVPAWLAFNQRRTVLEISVGDLNRLISETSRRAPRLDWQTKPKDAFVRQVIARSSQLFHDKRELSTAVEYLNMANDELEKRLKANRRELSMAANIQKGFIPGSVPDWEGVQFWTHFAPMTEVSGDLYDYFMLDARRMGFLVCDVSGHGVPAALISAIAKISFQNHRFNEPSQVFSKVNLDMINYVRMEGYLTAFYMILDADYELTYGIAGFPAPLLYRAATGEVERLEGTGTLLGMFPDATNLYDDHSLRLAPGDKLFIYTDGMPEARNPSDEQFGEARIIEAVKEAADRNLQDTCEHVISRHREFVLGNDPHDDLTLVGLMVSPRKGEFESILEEARSIRNGGDPAGACKRLRDAIAIFPRDPRALYLLGKYLSEDKQYREALENLKQFRLLRPYEPNAPVLMAGCLYHLNLLERAEQELRQSLALKPDNPSALYNLVKVYHKMGRMDWARDSLAALESRLGADDERVKALRAKVGSD